MKSVHRYITGLIFLVAWMVVIPGQAEAFNDTTQHWARMEIEHLQSREIISGYPDGSYRPESNISRQEFLVLMIRALNKQKEAEVLQRGTSSFTDTDTWARGYIELASEMNIIDGDGQDIFSPSRPINRQEAVSILMKCLGDEEKNHAITGFQDDDQISAWAYPSVSLAVNQGLVHGFPDNTFRPRNDLTRAQVAIILESLLTHLGRQHEICGTITTIDLPLHKANVNIAGREESFELASNLVVWNGEKHQPESEIKLPAFAYLDLNSSGKLAFILITEQTEKNSSVKLNYSALPGSEAPALNNSSLTPLVEGNDTDQSTKADYNAAAASLGVTGDAMGVKEFTEQTGATGNGQLIAVIDSGIDPGHPDLQSTNQGYQKMIDFVDLTEEGTVALTPVESSNGYLTLADARVDVSGLVNMERYFEYGYLYLGFLPESFGLADRKILIVLAAGKPGSGFNTVYIDTNNDGQIKDETAIKKYDRQVVRIKGDNDRSFNLVLSEISENSIKLGFDAFGHGTEVAGITAAHGKVEGIAPDAQLLVIKIMDRMGNTSLNKLKSALSMAAERGARVAVVSLGQYQMTNEEQESLAQTARLIWNTKSMIICMAAGNLGPGLGTVADSTGIDNIITVGAYATPKMWATDYGWQVPHPTLWYFSSAGPAPNAGVAPVLLAPGSAVSTYPMWADYQYHKNVGTSIAAPHLAGAAALLLDASIHSLHKDNAAAVYQVLLAGATPIEGFEAVEQGFGAVNLPGAWKELQLNRAKTALVEARQYSPGYGLAQGLYARGSVPASLSLHITNTGDTNTNFSLSGLADWLKPEESSIQVPAYSERMVEVNYDNLKEPGLYSSFLVADDRNSSGLDAALPQTVVVPYDMSKVKERELSGQLESGGLKHYFFQVPEGANRIAFTLLIKDSKGRARIYVNSPEGIRDTSSYAGIGKDENVLTSTLVYSYPESGIWEVVVYSSVSLSDYELKETDYTLQAKLEGECRETILPSDNRYFVSTVVPDFTPGKEIDITLNFWNRGSKLPANGLVAINGRLYEIQNGMVTLPYIPEQNTISLNLAW